MVPWSRDTARVICNVFYPPDSEGGKMIPFEGCCRGHSRGTRKVRVEYRSPDPKCNPYLAFAAMLSAGLAGIEENLELEPCDSRNFYIDHEGVKELPGNLGEALDVMHRSSMLRAKMGSFIIDTLYDLGKNMWKEYSQEISSIDIKYYL
jgi:glutamine synthetase